MVVTVEYRGSGLSELTVAWGTIQILTLVLDHTGKAVRYLAVI